jgi:hypothetical protein
VMDGWYECMDAWPSAPRAERSPDADADKSCLSTYYV